MSVLPSLCTTFQCIYIVVDALDECSELGNTREKLVAELGKFGPSVHILITSRRLGDIENALRQAPRITIHAADDDLRLYLKSQIGQAGHLVKLCLRDITLETSIIEAITEKAKGM